MSTFIEVKAVLDGAITDWKSQHHHDPDLTIHNKIGFAPFGWSTATELREATAKGFRLIDPSIVGQTPPRGSEALIVRILSGPVTLPLPNPPGGTKTFHQMPSGGPFLGAAQINVIADWIDAGCPD